MRGWLRRIGIKCLSEKQHGNHSERESGKHPERAGPGAESLLVIVPVHHSAIEHEAHDRQGAEKASSNQGIDLGLPHRDMLAFDTGRGSITMNRYSIFPTTSAASAAGTTSDSRFIFHSAWSEVKPTYKYPPAKMSRKGIVP
jgi:hypothetical protein